MKFYLLSILTLGLCLGAFAGTETKVRLKAQTLKGTTSVNAFYYLNAWGKREVRLESASIPVFESINPILGYGRDLDDDGRIETWFMIDQQQGMVIHQLGNADPRGIKTIRNRLFKLYKSSIKAHFAAAYGSIFSYLLMSVSQGWSSYKAFWVEWMDLEEFALRVVRARSKGLLTQHQWNQAIDLLAFGYRDTLKRFETATGSKVWKLAIADVALWTTGGIIVSWLGRGVAILGKPITQTALAREAKASLMQMVGGVKNRLGSQFARLRKAKGIPLSAVAARSFKLKFPLHMRGLMAKNRLMKKVLPAVARTGIAFKKAALEWKYIAFMTGIQLSTEAIASYDEVRHANPALMAKNVLTHPEIMQNVGYMSSNAFLMTAATNGIKRKGVRFAGCGFIALGNSTFTNIWIKGDTNYQRIALDTSWEATIGTAQVQADLKALSYFESQSLKSNNPRLKLIGWAIVMVDQTAGFAGYALVSRALEGKPQQKKALQVVPVIVEK